MTAAALPATTGALPAADDDRSAVAASVSRFAIGDEDFLLDGEPFRILSGAIHYFRVHPDHWADRIRKARLMGLNTIETYVAWNLHAPRRGEWDVTGRLDLARFLRRSPTRACARSCGRARTSAPSSTTAACRPGCSPTRRWACAATSRATSPPSASTSTGSNEIVAPAADRPRRSR